VYVALSMIVIGGGREGRGVEYIYLYLYSTGIEGGGGGVLYIGRYSFLEGFAFVWVGHGRGRGGVGFLRFLYFELNTELHTGFHGILFALAMVQ